MTKHNKPKLHKFSRRITLPSSYFQNEPRLVVPTFDSTPYLLQHRVQAHLAPKGHSNFFCLTRVINGRREAAEFSPSVSYYQIHSLLMH